MEVPASSKELWEEALSVLREKVNRQSFETWFRPINLHSVDNHRVEILLPNRFFKEWFEEHYLDLLKSTLEDLLFRRVEIALTYNTGTPQALMPEGEGKTARRLSRKRPEPYLNPRYTFDNFVVGPCNQFARAACLAVAEKLSKAYNPLFIYGGVGLGKTHLLHAIGNSACNTNPKIKLSYISSEKFTNDLINSIRFDSTAEFRNRYRGLDLLLIDDIQFIAGKERTQEEFFHTFNALYDAHKQIVISSDSPPKEIPTLEERLRSRFEWGLIADIQSPDLETKAAILKKKAQAEGVRIPDEVTLFIAKKVQSNIRELEGSLVRLIAFSSLTGREITLELTQEVLKELAQEEEKMITIPFIQQKVAEFYNIGVDDLNSKGRNKTLVLPRQVAMYLARTLTQSSLPAIGKSFGGKDHTTVLHACNKIKKRMAADEAFGKQIEGLTKKITS
ncbi:MAG: chromosomal replication initiator protein DnaA [candidate division NC10 bacterium]|nr:chromosomal replication initiator protein DnaA [candidate division NC10 bacterium]